MAKQSFTPGPWQIENDGGDLFIFVPASRGLMTFVLAERIGGEVFKGADGKYSDYSRVEANAQLIAAAPELLSAAQLALANLQRNLASEESCGQPFMGDDEHEAIAVLTSVIAKATGEQ